MHRYLEIIDSFFCTAGIFIFMAAYLLHGKYFGGSLDPRVMLAFACLLIMQGGGALVLRVYLLSGRAQAPVKKSSKGMLYPGHLSDAIGILAGNGLRCLNGGNNGNPACYGRRVGLSLMLEILAYAGLLFALVSGTINFGLGIRGYVMAAPGAVWVDLKGNTVMVQQGFMADRTYLASKIKVLDLKNGAGGHASQIGFEVAGRVGEKTGTYTLNSGDAVDIGKIRLRFLGDTYMVFSYVTKKDLDFQSEPVYLHRQKDGRGSDYRGELKLHQPGATGAMTYDPATSRFRVLINEKGRQGLDRVMAQGEVARQGEYAVQVTGLGHFGRIDIMRHNYRNQIFAGLFIMAAALVARLFSRPLRVWLWTVDGQVFFCTKSRKLHTLLAGC